MSDSTTNDVGRPTLTATLPRGFQDMDEGEMDVLSFILKEFVRENGLYVEDFDVEFAHSNRVPPGMVYEGQEVH